MFQVHGIDAAEKVVVRKQLRRGQVLAFFRALPRCLIGIEACATSHCWARELTKLGHQVRLMPAKDVKAYVKRNKNDAADAEAICEAVRRPTMRFVQIKSVEQHIATGRASTRKNRPDTWLHPNASQIGTILLAPRARPYMAHNVIHGAAKGCRYRINSGQTAPSGLTSSAAFDPQQTCGGPPMVIESVLK